MKMINTVLGEIHSNEIGNVLSHEHIICCSHAMKIGFGDKWYNTEEVIDIASKLLKQAKDECGIDTIIDGTPLNLGRDINLLQEVSRKSGVNIIASTGLYYTEDFFLRNKSPELLAEFFIDECLNGIGDTGIKPEFLKCATSENGVTALNEKSLATMAIVQKNTGLPLYAHNHHQDKTTYAQIKVLEKNGANLEKLIVGHSSDSCDIDYLEDFLKLGCYLGFDRIWSDCENQAKTLYALISRGWEDKLLLSHDYPVFSDSQNCSWASFKETIFDSKRNYTTVSKFFLPKLRSMGVSEKQINKMMHDNPLQLMTKL